MRSRKSRGLRGYSCGSASARGVSNDTSSSSWAGGVVDSFDRALLSSVSAKVIRLLGVSNDLRDRGDEWPLLSVVSGLSVVVATVVDEASMVLAALRSQTKRWAARRCGRVESLRNSAIAQQCGCQLAWPNLVLSWFTWPLRPRCSSHSLCAVPALRAARIASLIQVCTSNAASKHVFFAAADFEKTRQPPSPASLRTCVRVLPSLVRPARTG